MKAAPPAGGDTGARSFPARIWTRPALLTGRPWRALRTPNYRLYLGANLVSQTGRWMQRVAEAWLVLDITGSPVALGIVTALQFLPTLFLSLFSGVLADRFPKRSLIILTQAGAMLEAFALGALVVSNTVQLWEVYVLALLLGVITAIEQPARQSFVSELVDRDNVQSAVGLNSTVFNAARVLGPSLGGVIVAAVGAGWCFMFNGVSYLAVLAGLALMRGDQFYPSRRPKAAAMWTQLVDGVKYAGRTPALVLPLMVVCFLSTFGYNFTVTLALLARYALDAGPVGYGTMNAALGLGALAGALVSATRTEPNPSGLLLAAVGFGGALLAVAIAPWYVATLLLLAVVGVFGVTSSNTANATLQMYSREEYRGRILSLYALVFVGTTPLGGVLTGWLADVWSIRWALAFEASMCVAGAGVGFLYMRRHGISSRGAEAA